MNRGPSLVPAMVIGAGAGFALGLPLAYVVATAVSKPLVEQWKLVPIVVAAVDAPRGTKVSMEKISQRSIPARFAAEWYVRPNDVSPMIGKVLQTSVAAGEPMRWSMVDETATGGHLDRPSCSAALRASPAGKEATPTVLRVLETVEHREREP